MIGQVLLRILYRRVPVEYYGEPARGLRGYSRVLDLGGGNGALYRALGCREYYVVLDVDEQLASMAPSTVCTERVVGDSQRLPLRSEGWRGAIVFHDSLHHFEDPVGALREAARVLREGAVMVYDYSARGVRGRLLYLFEKLLGFPARFLDPGEASKPLREAGLEVIVVDNGFSYRLVAVKKPGREG